MRILITNDDGIYAEGMLPLVRWCAKLGQVTVVAPKVEQSAKSHGIEIHKAFEARPVELEPGVTAWAVDSTPADCVRFAVLGQKMEFDLVISGVNRGLNIGTDMLYSGTVSAACEAGALGIPALAISTPPGAYHRCTEHLDRVFDYIRELKLLEKHSLYNVNIPAQAGEIRITRQGGPYYSDEFPAIGGDMYRPTGKCVFRDRGDDTLDTDAVMHGYISIMPLTIDKTDMRVFQALTE